MLLVYSVHMDLEGKRINIRYDLYGVTQKQHSRKGTHFTPAHWTQI